MANSEQVKVGGGAGLANCGRIPFVSAASCFLAGQTLQQIKADIAFPCRPPVALATPAIAWTKRHDAAQALDGSNAISAQATTCMAWLLGLPGAAELSDLAQTVPDAASVAFVPALAGLGAP